MQPSDRPAVARDPSLPLPTQVEGLGIAPPQSAPVPQAARAIPAWLLKLQRERYEQRRGKEGGSGLARPTSPAHTSGGCCPGAMDKSGDLADPLTHGDDTLDDAATLHEATSGDVDGLNGADEPDPSSSVPLPLPAGLDVVPPASRHSYGDFSSASSTTSSSASTSGFSSHSASSATTVSSTTTFSAAGWNGGCPPLPLQELVALSAEDVCGGKGEDADTPSAESCETACALSAPVSPVPPHGDETVTLSSLSASAPAAGAVDSLRSSSLPRPASPSTASVSSSTILPEPPAPLDDSILTPPDNFAMVSPGLYRSSFPRRANFSFLRSLGLKSVMVLVQEPYPEENLEFLRQEGIQFFQFGIPGNKEPFVSIPEEKLVAAMAAAVDTRNLPMLIHCNKGKHRTGCVIGCLRRLQKWSLTAVFEEYRRYSFPKSRALDLQCIEAFGGLGEVLRIADRQYLPPWAAPDPPPPPPPT